MGIFKRSAMVVLAMLALVAAHSVVEAAESEDDFMAPFEGGLTEKIAKANETCFGCHTEGGLKNPPQAGLDLAKLAATLVSPDLYATSAHTGMDCRDCHAGPYASYPHSQPVVTAKPCIECHARRVSEAKEQFEASVHFKTHPQKFGCQTCHDAHVYSSARRIGKPRDIVRQDNAGCIDCHGSEQRYRTIVGPDKPFPDFRAAHSWLPNREFHWIGVRCVDCHTTIPASSVSHELFPKEKASKNCVVCHTMQSALSNRLYRHLVDDTELSTLFTNAKVLPESYVIGATRSILIDRIAIILVSLALGVVLAHGALRWVLAMARRRRGS